MPDPTTPAADAPGESTDAPETGEYSTSFKEFAGGQPPDTENDPPATPAAEPPPSKAAGEADAGQSATDDPPPPDDDRVRWESMTDDDRFSAWKGTKGRLSKEVSALARRNQELERAVQAAQSAPPPAAPAQPTQKEVADAIAGSSEDWAKFAEEYPEVAAAIDGRIGQVESRIEGLGETVTRTVDERLQPVLSDREKAAADAEKAAMMEAHADWKDVVLSSDYQGWLATQTPGVQQLANTPFAGDLTVVLDRFKASESYAGPATPPGTPAPADGPSDVERIQQQRDARLNASVSVPSSSRTTVRPAGTDDFGASFKGFAQARNAQQQNAR